MDLLLVAFGSFIVVEFAKAALPVKVPPWGLLVAVLVAAFALSHGFESATPANLGFAGAGLAAVIQKVHRLLSAAGDAQQVRVLTTARGPARF